MTFSFPDCSVSLFDRRLPQYSAAFLCLYFRCLLYNTRQDKTRQSITITKQHFYARLSCRNSVRLSVCLSVRLSHGWISAS